MDGSNFARIFPELFPFGFGHPGIKRSPPVSLLECIRYYLDISTRRFAQHHQFLAVAFDRLSLNNMFMANYLQCQKQSANIHKIATVTSMELDEFLNKTKNHQVSSNASILMKSN